MSEELRENEYFKDCEHCEDRSGLDRWEDCDCTKCDGLGIILTEKGAAMHEIAWRTHRLMRRTIARTQSRE